MIVHDYLLVSMGMESYPLSTTPPIKRLWKMIVLFIPARQRFTLPETNSKGPWKILLGRLISFSECLLLGEIFVLGRVKKKAMPGGKWTAVLVTGEDGVQGAPQKMEVLGAWCIVVTKDFHLKNGKPQTHENGRSEESVFFLVPSLRAISKGSVEESILWNHSFPHESSKKTSPPLKQKKGYQWSSYFSF